MFLSKLRRAPAWRWVAEILFEPYHLGQFRCTRLGWLLRLRASSIYRVKFYVACLSMYSSMLRLPVQRPYIYIRCMHKSSISISDLQSHRETNPLLSMLCALSVVRPPSTDEPLIGPRYRKLISMSKGYRYYGRSWPWDRDLFVALNCPKHFIATCPYFRNQYGHLLMPLTIQNAA